jgi:NADH dehydrogenase
MQEIISLTGRKSRLVSLPFPVAKLQGAVLQMLPGQILTLDQVRSLQSDNILSGGKPGLRDLGVDPTPLEAILPTYMKRFRSGGRFASRHAA